ncbi:MAG: hypothetical protein CMD82_01395 [Gammaproteobacteria bacterium]|nr:hypothetical protein [Gammaproteobacteria bacterium]|tara:strand:- start:254 stop:487 length:234 start_codon:yes stop_codon:yes gene_type:complete
MLESKLKWKCRKGIRELDLLLTSYIENIFHTLPKNEQLSFVEFLEKDTYDILDILMGKKSYDHKFESIVSSLKNINK